MTTSMSNNPDFHALDPNTILQLIEDALGKELSLLCRPYTSYINRVYELETKDNTSIVAKFYRPGRWDKNALQDEHDFLLELADAEIPIIAPLQLKNGTTLGVDGNMCFAVFPKKGGRFCDELNDDEWIQFGRLVGRVHQIGSSKSAKNRVTWRPDIVTKRHIDFIFDGNYLPLEIEEEYNKVTSEFIELASPLFENVPLLRIHGDLHFSNLIYRPGESFFMIDFDDMALGPSVQDLWMLLPGYREDVQRQINLFAEGYEMFRIFPYSELNLIEILRGMRYIHFCAWCAHQSQDDRFVQNKPNWGTMTYWREEINDLRNQIIRIETDLSNST